MASYIATGAVHHMTLTVADVDRACQFYTGTLGFKVAGNFGSRVVLSNGSVILALGLAPGPAYAPKSNRFDENLIGLDHLSFTVGSREKLEQAARFLDERGVSHGEIVDLADFRVYVLMLRDPDNIQIELTAHY
jgi:glyoxylase I family protein